MNYKQVIKHNFNRSAINYDRYNHIQRKIAEELFTNHLDKISAQDIILDAGCGTGYIYKLIRECELKNPIYQIDLAYNMCKIANNYCLDKLYTINADIEFSPFKDNSFDLIISSLALQWTDIKLVTSKFYHNLKNKGKILISLFNQDSLNELAQSFLILDNTKRIMDLPKVEIISKILKSLNFKNIDIRNFSMIDYHKTSIELMQQIKSIGASINQNNNYLNKKKLRDLESIYFDNFAIANKLPATWKYSIIYATK